MSNLAPTAVTELDRLGATLTRTGLQLPKDLAFNDWRRIGNHLLTAIDRAHFALGDWITYGDRYRTDYPEAMAELQLELFERRTDAYVASRVPQPTREHRLTWPHHRAIAPLPADQQRLWLDEALRHDWTARDLEQAIAEHHTQPARLPMLTFRAIGELHDLCTRAAEHDGLEPADWAARVLERAARETLQLEAA